MSDKIPTENIIKNKYPLHIAIIMDGNRRWAEKKGKFRFLGYKQGLLAAKKAIHFSIKNNIKILTLYAFSQENWNRSIDEIEQLTQLLRFGLNSEIKNFKKYNVKIKIIGDIKRFNKKLQEKIKYVEKMTYFNSGLLLNIAANYSGKWDILQSIKKIFQEFQKKNTNIEDITENTFSKYLSTASCAPVDLVIRTGGEKRISNFLLWQIAYSELYFTDVLWPDFDEYIFQHAIDFFLLRERRFGGSGKKK